VVFTLTRGSNPRNFHFLTANVFYMLLIISCAEWILYSQVLKFTIPRVKELVKIETIEFRTGKKLLETKPASIPSASLEYLYS